MLKAIIVEEFMDYSTILKKQECAIYDLRGLYESYGYRLYKTGKFEDYELYARNKDFIGDEGILTFTDPYGRLMALKPDVTLSIAKNSSDEQGIVQKFYYDDEVYRLIPGSPDFREIMQTGIECIGDLSAYDVCEVIALAARSLELISEDSILDISHMGIVKGLIDLLSLPADQSARILSCIRNKNVHECISICEEFGVSAVLSEALAAMITTYGPMDQVLEGLDRFVIGADMQDAAAQLTQIRDTLKSAGFDRQVRFDFSVAGHMGYYDGVIFQGFVEGVNQAVLSGGRYDHLMKKMGRASGAIGFAVSLSRLENLGREDKITDVDVILLYDRDEDPAAIDAAAKSFRADGSSVYVTKCIPSGLRAGRTVRIQNGEVRDEK